ncbi:MAG: HAD-IA family hydrolase [Gammaproteobacteria bacterium]|nr:HAD-IA family hydrolase [Gammaproteobacteria bacterium]
MIRHLVLDWSGTLCDDEGLTLDATNQVLQHYGAAALDLAKYQRVFQLPVERFYEPLIGPVARAEVDELFFQHYRQKSGSHSLFPGVAEMLLELKGWGFDLCILSTMEQALLEVLVERAGIADYFQEIRGSAPDKTQVLPEMVQRLGFAPERTLYVGDTPHDIDAAHAAGVVAGAALYGYCEEGRLRVANPDHCFDDIGAMHRLCRQDYLLDSNRLVLATVGAVVANGAGAVLLVRTRKWGDRWGIPGGKIEYGETMEAACQRELLEETGLQLGKLRWLMVQDCIESPEFWEPRHFLLINYFCQVEGQPPLRSNYESQQIGWYPLAEALQKNLNQPTRSALEESIRLGYLERL